MQLLIRLKSNLFDEHTSSTALFNFKSSARLVVGKSLTTWCPPSHDMTLLWKRLSKTNLPVKASTSNLLEDYYWRGDDMEAFWVVMLGYSHRNCWGGLWKGGREHFHRAYGTLKRQHHLLASLALVAAASESLIEDSVSKLMAVAFYQQMTPLERFWLTLSLW